MLATQVRKAKEMQSKFKHLVIIERIKMRREYCFGILEGSTI